MEAVFNWVATYGYAGLFLLLTLGVVGLPIPDETLLVFSGYLIAQGKLSPVGTAIAAVCGSWCGISLSYTIGRTLGIGVVHRFGKYLHISDERLDHVHAWFNKAGHWALFGGYYIAGFRHVTAIIAGASKLEARTFILFAWSGAVCWVAVFLTLGYNLGENWRQIAELIHRDVLYLTLAAGAGAVIFLLVRRYRNQHPGKERNKGSGTGGSRG